jgi:glycine cleavage system H lipoate-binding protein
MVILIFVAFIVISISIDALVRYYRKRVENSPVVSQKVPAVFNESTVLIPQGLYFDKTHTWAFMEANGLVKVGIDDFLQHVTGTLSRVKLKKNGEKIMKGEPLLTITRFGKQLTIKSPVTGFIKSQNVRLETDSKLINSSPFHDGWVYMVEPSHWFRDLQFLVMADKYKEWLSSEFIRLKDFLAIVIKQNNEKLVPVILQDGGELTDHVLADFGPEIWEDFQLKFIDSSKFEFGKSDSTFTIFNI